MSDQENPRDHAWAMMEKVRTCLFITRDGDKLRGRPMSATVDKDEGAIYFLAKKGTDKEEEAIEGGTVTLSFQDGQDFVVVSGHPRFSSDRAKIRELFGPMAKAWFEGPEDPTIRLITVIPDEAEYWDTPGKLVTVANMLAAAVTGAKPYTGKNEQTAM
jgi:general stress protein 26